MILLHQLSLCDILNCLFFKVQNSLWFDQKYLKIFANGKIDRYFFHYLDQWSTERKITSTWQTISFFFLIYFYILSMECWDWHRRNNELCIVQRCVFILHLNWSNDSRIPKETGVDRTRRHCSVETIRGTGPSELGWSWPMSKNPLERAWSQWDQRRRSNRREQILHFDLSQEAITKRSNSTSSHSLCPTYFTCFIREREKEQSGYF